MSVKKFKFVSPGIFLNEIDNSQLPKSPLDIGPLFIGRTRKGPAMKPTVIESFSDFVETFGNPVDGTEGGDLWRRAGGSAVAPTYAAYAAQAWLTNNSPATVVRLLGREHTSATAAGKAGWWTAQVADQDTQSTHAVAATAGGAFGLLLLDSSSYEKMGEAVNSAVPLPQGETVERGEIATGSLAAIWYVDQGTVELSGALRGATATEAQARTGSAALIQNTGADKEFVVQIKDSAHALVETVTFNFNRNSSRYIRKVFNTNPTLLNSSTTQTSQIKNYWLGETFDRMVADNIQSGSVAGDMYGMIVALRDDGGTNQISNFRMDAQAAKTPWVKPQHLGREEEMEASLLPNLFRLVSHLGGQHDMHSVKVSITDIKASTSIENEFGTFAVLVRKVSDTDKRPVILERFGNLNLNPASPNYIKRRIGDRYQEFDSTSRRNKTYGEYDNNSKYFRVEVDEDLDGGAYDPAYLPFGFQTPPSWRSFSFLGTGSVHNIGDYDHQSGDATAQATTGQWIAGAEALYTPITASLTNEAGALYFHLGATGSESLEPFYLTASIKAPSIALRANSSDGGFTKPTDAYWGFDTGRSVSDLTFDESNLDIVRPKPTGFNSLTFTAGTALTQNIHHHQFFTLDDLSGSGTNGNINPQKGEAATWVSGSRALTASISSLSTGSTDGYKAVLNAGFNKFTMPVFGGFDGLDIKEKDPFRNSQWTLGATTSETDYAFNSVMEAIDSVAEPEDVEYNLLSVPGVTFDTLTDRVMEVAETRGDALAVIDIPQVYTAKSENTSTFKNRLGSVGAAVDALNDRNINNNYACAYYPWVQIKDTVRGSVVWAPPSIAAVGAMSFSDRRSEPWFAPAGFNRGGLSNGAAGIPVISVTEKLSAADRDDLYDARINPIASFPAEGIVIFGQKTLQVGASALDRINVRRLMILIKKQISRMASRVLFDQNVQVTWNRFLGMVEPFLRSVQTRLGLEDFRVVLDATTTTPDLVDRNIMYAKIYLKPARSIEYIAIDFNITRSGAAFED